MATLANRLEKLEKDLQMLTAMQHLIVDSDDFTFEVQNSDLPGLEIPTRDIGINSNTNVPHSKVKPKGITRKSPGSTKAVPVPASSIPAPTLAGSLHLSSAGDTDSGHHPIDLESNPKYKELSEKLANLEAKLLQEEKNRFLADGYKEELSAQMTKKEEELEREKDCKNGLLRLTLQLKNQLNEKENRIINLESSVGALKSEKGKIMDDVETLKRNTEKIDVESRDLLQRHCTLTEENEGLKQLVAQLENQQKLQEQSSTTHEKKLILQVNQLVAKCAQIDQSRDATQMTSKRIQQRLDQKEVEVQELLEKVSKLESERERSAMLHECALNKLQMDAETESAQVNQKIASCHNVLSQTKEIFVKLSLEKQELEQALASRLSSHKNLNIKLEESQQAFQELEKVSGVEIANLKSLLDKTQEEVGNLKHKNQEFQRSKLKMKVENAQLTKNLDGLKEKWGKQVKSLEEKKCGLEGENDTLRKELKNVNDNLSILQKISQDQISSLKKFKSELEEYRKSEFNLKAELRTAEDALEASNRKLGSEEHRVLELEEEVEYLQHKHSQMENDLKNHSCEDFVESTCKKKLAILERQVKTKEGELERSIRDLTSDRDKAISAAKRAVNKAVEMKAEWESNILEIRSQAKQDSLKAQVETRREVSEKNLQIQTLEMELEKLRQSSGQTHRTLLQKIHQLQSALNICVGSFSQQSPIHQHQFPDPAGMPANLSSLFLG